MQTAEWFDTEGLAAWLHVPAATVKQWRHKGVGPRGHRVGRFIRYRRADVERWLETRADRGERARSA